MNNEPEIPEKEERHKFQTQIQQAYSKAKDNNAALQLLTNVFNAVDKWLQNPKDPQIQKLIKEPVVASENTQAFLDNEYPSNKNGVFGALNRKCTIVDEGVNEAEGFKPPILKLIKGFKNEIQTVQTKNKYKLEWIKNNEEYPYRIILKDSKDYAKGIYFETQHQAQLVRLHYVNKFIYKGKISQLMQQFHQAFSQKIIVQFYHKLITIKKGRKQLRKSKNSKQLLNESSIKRNDSQRDKDSIKESKNKSNNSKQLLNENSLKRIGSQKNKDSFKERKSKNSKQLLNENSLKRIDSQRNKGSLKESHKEDIQIQNQSRQSNNEKNQMKNKKNQLKNERSQLKIENQQSQLKDENLLKFQVPMQQQNIIFKSIQFLRENKPLIKPKVTITLYKSGNAESTIKFDTIIQRRDPHLCYELIPNSQVCKFTHPIGEYDMQIKVVDFLTSNQILYEKISLLNKEFQCTSWLKTNTVRLLIALDDENLVNEDETNNIENRLEGYFLQIEPLSLQAKEQIRQYWQKTDKGLTTKGISFNFIQILQLVDQPPKSWTLNLSYSQCKRINLLSSASKILKFKLIESILPILKVIERLYSDTNQFIEVTLSIIVDYCKPYYCMSQLNKINELHIALGLQGEIEFTSKVGLEMRVIKKIVEIQCPEFKEETDRKNIGYVHLLYQYIYELYSRNFHIQTLIQVWNFLFKEPPLISMHMVLLSVWIILFYHKKLIICNNFQEVKEVLESCQTCHGSQIVCQILQLKQKYFQNSNNGIFLTRLIQQAVMEFYKGQNQRLDLRKQNRTVEKQMILKKLSNEIISLPSYPQHCYCLHIYFYKVPTMIGSLYLKANNTEYQCLNIPKSRYFIIGQVNTQIILEFINNKSEQFTAQLQCMQGINAYSAQLKSQKTNQTYIVQYMCGLLTQTQIEGLKKNKKLQDFIGSFASKQKVFNDFVRPVNQSFFLNFFSKKVGKEDLGKKIKVAFCNGSTNFLEQEFYHHLISSSFIPIQSKLQLIKAYAMDLSQQHFLSNCQDLQKVFLCELLKTINFYCTPEQFKSYYTHSMQNQFDSPKIIKCLLVLPNGTQYKLESTAISYQSAKAETHIFEDIIINELISWIQKKQQAILVNVNEATLDITYSNFGSLTNICIPLIKKKSNKDFVVDESKFFIEGIKKNDENDVCTAEPQLLMTEIIPKFSKINHRNSKNEEENSAKKRQSIRKVAQQINVLGICNKKLNKIIRMRYYSHPKQIKFPFLNYFHELMYDQFEQELPTNISSRTSRTKFQLSTSNGLISTTSLHSPNGFAGNGEQPTYNALFFANYGYGIYRWEPCHVIDYSFKFEEDNTQKLYLIEHRNKKRYCKIQQLKMSSQIQQSLQQNDKRRTSQINNKSYISR